MEVNFDKVLQPSTSMEFLGIILDSHTMELKISDERMSDIISELKTWSTKNYGTKRELLSLLGKLVFICRVIRPGRIFLRRLFRHSCKVKYLHHRTRLSAEAMRDIEWWLNIATTWNRHSFFYEDRWLHSNLLDLASDASDIGFAGVYKSHWFMKEFSEAQSRLSIACVNCTLS